MTETFFAKKNLWKTLKSHKGIPYTHRWESGNDTFQNTPHIFTGLENAFAGFRWTWKHYCPWAYCVGSSLNSLFVCLLSVRLSVRPSASGSVLDQKSAEGTRWRAGSRSKTRPFGTFSENTPSTRQFKCPACSNLEIFLHNRSKGHPCPAGVI